ncbi:MAG: PEP-CTERM sorting domain-containing protein [Gammaproteobacteria bacterium]
MKYCSASVLALAAALGSAHAEEVSFEYKAVITETQANGVRQPDVAFSGTKLTEGYTVTGIITLDLSLQEYSDGAPGPGPHTVAMYKSGLAATRATMTVDQTGFIFASKPQPWMAEVRIVNDSYDHLFIETPEYTYPAPPDTIASQGLTFNLHDDEGTVLNSLSQPTSLSLAGWESATLRYYANPNGDSTVYSAYATLTSLRPVAAPVPEPASAAMLSLGLLAVGGAAYRRRRAAPDA